MALVAVKATHQALHQLYIAVALDPIAIDLEVKSVGIRLVEMWYQARVVIRIGNAL